MKIKVILFVSLVEILLSSCTFQPIELEAEYSRFDIPETIGKNKFHAGGSIGTSSTIVSFKEEVNDPVNVTNPKIESAKTTKAFKGGYGLLDRLDVGVRLNNASLVYVKAMIVGKPFKVAIKGNYSLAVTAGYGKHNNITNDITGEDEVVRFDYEDYALIAGYRPTDRLLTYASIFKTEYDYEFIASDSIAGSDILYNGELSITGIALGVNYSFLRNKRLNATFEILNSDIKTRLSNDKVTTYGVGVWFAF